MNAKQIAAKMVRHAFTATAPNFVRGAVVPMTALFQTLKHSAGVTTSAAIVGALCVIIGIVALTFLEETYGRHLDFIED